MYFYEEKKIIKRFDFTNLKNTPSFPPFMDNYGLPIIYVGKKEEENKEEEEQIEDADLESRIIDITPEAIQRNGEYHDYSKKQSPYLGMENDPIIIKKNSYSIGSDSVLGFITMYTSRPIIVVNEDLVKNVIDFNEVVYHEKTHRFIKDEWKNRKATATEDPSKIINYSRYAA